MFAGICCIYFKLFLKSLFNGYAEWAFKYFESICFSYFPWLIFMLFYLVEVINLFHFVYVLLFMGYVCRFGFSGHNWWGVTMCHALLNLLWLLCLSFLHVFLYFLLWTYLHFIRVIFLHFHHFKCSNCFW